MASKIIDSSDPGIVVKETTIHLSDEKLRGVLLRTYEHAQKDMGKFKFHKFYDVFLSIAGTLFLTLLTTEFNQVGALSAVVVTGIAWTICVLCGILGFILMGVRVDEKTKSHTEERDAAINKVLDEIL